MPEGFPIQGAAQGQPGTPGLCREAQPALHCCLLRGSLAVFPEELRTHSKGSSGRGSICTWN